MAFIEPPDFGEPLEVFNELTGGGGPNTFSGFATDPVPGTSGRGTRQSRIVNNRPAQNVRHLMHWFVPEQPIVQMYMNPNNVSYNYKKAINNQRTKGGYVVQYWGEELSVLNMQGTTGTSGIEGINVLLDVYRNEQLAIDPYALFIAATKDQAGAEGIGSAIGGALGGDVGSAIGGAVGGAIAGGSSGASLPMRPTPSLAQFACSVELYWMSEVYRGYFTSFTVTERADNLGMFEYQIEFVVTQKRGFRQNFLPWHRSATTGPSAGPGDMYEMGGPAYSYGARASDQAMPRRDSGVLLQPTDIQINTNPPPDFDAAGRRVR